jgi:nicotinamidase-related amidase
MKRSRAALLLIDVINDLEFPGSAPLVRAAERVAPRIERLATRARAARVPVIYVNDNFGRWRSDLRATVDECTAEGKAGRSVGLRLRPHAGDYFVLKPKHSGFLFTPLELLLADLGVRSLVLSGFATDLCVLFTAHDAHMRGFELWVPSDATAANSPAITRNALGHLRTALQAHTPKAASIDFARLERRAPRQRRRTAARTAR